MERFEIAKFFKLPHKYGNYTRINKACTTKFDTNNQGRYTMLHLKIVYLFLYFLYDSAVFSFVFILKSEALMVRLASDTPSKRGRYFDIGLLLLGIMLSHILKTSHLLINLKIISYLLFARNVNVFLAFMIH